MTQRDAKRRACQLASLILTDTEAVWEYLLDNYTDADRERIERAIEELAQELYERGCPPTDT